MGIAVGVTDDGTARTIWLLDDGTETADTCEVCEVPFAKRRANHVTCGKLDCQRRHEAKARGGVVRADLAPIPCASCKVPFRPTRKGGVTCGAKTCKSRRHDARGADRRFGPLPATAPVCTKCGKSFTPKRPRHPPRVCYAGACQRADEKDKYDRWYAVEANAKKHRGKTLAKIRERRAAAKREVAPPAPLEAPPSDPWGLPAPAYAEYLPGAAMALHLWTTLRIEHRHARALHAVVTGLLGAQHEERAPCFALIPTRMARGGWGLYVADDALARALVGTTAEVKLFDVPARLRVGAAHRIRAPHVEPGRHVLRIDTITPVVIRTHLGTGVEVTHRAPTASGLLSALTMALPTRLGVEVDPSTVRIELLEHTSEEATVSLSKLGDVRGWEGSLVVACNAPARWLLECAARVGLGGRVAFGFGRIVVREASSGGVVESVGPSLPLRERLAELYVLLTQRQRDILTIFAEAQRAHRPGSRGGAAGRFFVSPHAVARYIERVESLDYEQALARCIVLGERAQRVAVESIDPETGETCERWAAPGPDGRRVDFLVGLRHDPRFGAGWLPQIVTVLPVRNVGVALCEKATDAA